MSTTLPRPTRAQIDDLERRGILTARKAAVLREIAPVDRAELEVKPVLEAGPDVPWREWVPKYYLKRDCGPFADFHVNAWEWFDNLELDEKSASAIVPWARGLGKSTTLEGGIVRTCVKGTRRFVLYVSRTLDDANNHVMAIARVLERMGIERQVNKYGLAVGWNAQRLRTASGFSILSFGLDAGARGIKLDDVRPDLICLDDIDHLGDSAEMVEKKCRIITNTIMQAGSPSFATIFVQNPIGPHTVMSRVLDGRLGIMADRDMKLAELIPAVYDLKYDTYYSEDGREMARITGGRSSWEGKTLEDWQYQIDKGTIDGFLIECQHEIHLGSSFFARFENPAGSHVINPLHTPKGIDGPMPPQWFTFFGGFDWGYSDPSAFTLCATDETGSVHVLESWEEDHLTNDQYADKVALTLSRWGASKRLTEIYADASMWNRETHNGVQAEAVVESFYRAALNFVKSAHGAEANRHRNSVIVTYLASDHKMKVYRGYNSRLIECLASAQPAKTDREQVKHDEYSHLVYALGCAMSSRPMKSVDKNKPRGFKDELHKMQETQRATRF